MLFLQRKDTKRAIMVALRATIIARLTLLRKEGIQKAIMVALRATIIALRAIMAA